MFDKCAKMSPKMLANSLISVYRAKTLGQVWKKNYFLVKSSDMLNLIFKDSW